MYLASLLLLLNVYMNSMGAFFLRRGVIVVMVLLRGMMLDFAASHPLRVFVTFSWTLELGRGIGAVGFRVAEGGGFRVAEGGEGGGLGGRAFCPEWPPAFFDESALFSFLVEKGQGLWKGMLRPLTHTRAFH